MANYRGVKPLTGKGANRLTTRHNCQTTVLRFNFQIIKTPYKTYPNKKKRHNKELEGRK